MPDEVPRSRRADPAVDAVRPEPVAGQAWFARDAGAALAAFATAPEGLSEAEAGSRLATFGPNRLPAAKKRSALVRFILQFHNLFIYVLLASAAVSVALGHFVDASVIVLVALVNAVIGYVQEGRAEDALTAIRGMIDPRAAVVRDGRRVTVAAEQIVPGDIVLVEAGDRIPADIRLLRARSLKIDEAPLTGESVPVVKSAEPVAADAALGDRASMAYSGTFVAAGQGSGVLVPPGGPTGLRPISAPIGAVEPLTPPPVRPMDGFARQVTAVILAVSALAFVFAVYVRGYAAGEAFMTVIGLAVAAIPEGMPAIMTITLAIGVQRMARRNAIIRRLPAVETLGSVSVICSDKTGTLTRNEMTAQALAVAGATVEVTGVGYAPVGQFREAGAEIDPAARPLVTELIRAGLLCNDAGLRQNGAAFVVDGDPMEGALVTLAVKAGMEPEALRRAIPRTDEIPFDAAHRFMATLHHSHDGDAFVFVKGAPERILAMCAFERGPDGDRPIDAAAWRDRADRLAAGGQRILAFARKPAAAGKRDLTFADVESEAVLLGLVGFIDPPRAEAVAAVADCHDAGIRVAMITGDHAATAREIGRQLGLARDPKVLAGADLDGLDAEALRHAALSTDVFARTTPEHKLRLVEALQADGLTVAMTGDGVNDAPALKRADVGVAMGGKGTEAAKEAAEMVLADDNFASIVSAVREGRTVYDNLMKVIAWTLPTNGGEAMTIIAAIVFGFALPMTPVQILWVNMVTSVALGLTLAFEPTEPGALRRPPRPSDAPILTGGLVWRIVFVSFLFVIGTFGVFFWAEARGLPIETARTMVVNTLVVMEIFYLFSVRYVHGTSLTLRGFIGTPAVLISVALGAAFEFAFTYFPPIQEVFGSTAVSFLDGLAIVGVGVAVLFVVEVEKAVRRRLAPDGTAAVPAIRAA